MKRLLIIAILMSAVCAYAAGKQYYNYPDSPRLYDDARIQIYNNDSGSRNITGQLLKEQINNNPMFKSPVFNSSTSAASLRTYMYFRQSDGALVITGTPP